MPNRIIKESIRSSDDLASVSPEAERLFWRLVVSVDDFGRFDARPNTLIGQCLTAFLGRVNVIDINKWLAELEAAGLVEVYIIDDRPYLVLTKWSKHQRVRAKDSKFPSPDDSRGHSLSSDSIRGQLRTFASSPVNVNEFVNVNESGNENVNVNDESHDDDKGRVSRLFTAFQDIFKHHPNKVQEQDLLEYMDKGMDVDLMIEDFKETLRRDKPVKYALSMIKNQYAQNVLTLKEYQEVESQRQTAAGGGTSEHGRHSSENRTDGQRKSSIIKGRTGWLGHSEMSDLS